MAAAPAVIQWIEEGDELHQALRSSGIFPEDYLQMVEMGEHSGTVPESLQRLSPELEEQAQRSLKILAEVAGYVIWAIVAGLIIFVIFSIFSKYVAMLNQAGNF